MHHNVIVNAETAAYDKGVSFNLIRQHLHLINDQHGKKPCALLIQHESHQLALQIFFVHLIAVQIVTSL